jgi:DNA polymerase-3 subunit gamma/tau
MVSFSGGKVILSDVLQNLDILDHNYYFQLTEYLLTQDVSNVLILFEKILQAGFEGDNFLSGLSEHFRDLLVCKDPQTIELLTVSDSLKQRYQQQAGITPAAYLINALNVANQCDLDYKMARNKKLHVELALIRMAYLGTLEPGAPATLNIPQVKPEPTSLPEEQSEPEPAAVVPTPEPLAEQVQEEPEFHPEPQPEQVVQAEPSPEPVPEITPEPDAGPAPIAQQDTPVLEPQEAPAMVQPESVEPAMQAGSPIAPAPKEKDSPASEAIPAPPASPTDSIRLTDLASVDQMINQKGQDTEEESEEEAEDEGPVDQEAVVKIWQAFSEKMKDGGKMSIWSLMTAVSPVAEGGTVVIKVENSLMENQIGNIRTELAAHLAVELGRKQVALQITVERSDDGEKKDYQ